MNPFLEIPAAKAISTPSPMPVNPSKRILVVEDDVTIRQLNAQVLLRSGYQVDAAEDGIAGWEALHAKKFDLLITDHNMPRLSGLELVKKVRLARMIMPIIMAAGMLPEEEIERHPWLQLAATLLKPFSGDELLETVKAVLCATTRNLGGPEIRLPLLSITLK
jgi:DNA-binding response OmpR family regulator